MIELHRSRAKLLEELFAYSEETMIRSFTQGHMGRGWVNDLRDIVCAQILVGDFCVFAGDHRDDEAINLVKNIPSGHKTPWMLMIPQNDGWGGLIETVYGDIVKKISRYAIKKEKDCFDEEKLRRFIGELPDEFQLTQIDEALYHQTFLHDFSQDFCSQFSSAEDYLSRGLGYCAVHRGEIVSGASSYTVYDEGIEIEIATKSGYRRQGLAAACAAKLILHCLERGLYPSWDAANKASVALAEKLGYHFDFEYDAYEVDIKKIFERKV
ncbi:MAG: GNAT family N-acetyltransferase [Oscillospiraceae bacterium]|nr:GNAT family N-acetyltransferase [Oscillospiraceae bacterium]